MTQEKNIPYVLSVDHGTSGCKVALVSVHGEVIDFDYEPVPTSFLPGGGAEQDPGDWWRALVSATRRLLGKDVVPVDRIVAVGVSSTFSSTVAVDESGKHLMNSLTWMDSRGASYVREIVKGFPSVMGYNLPRMWQWIRLTGGGPQLSGKDDVAHVLLVKNEYPEIYEKTCKFLGSKDYLNLRLTGEFAASFDSIMLFWVTDTRDVNDITYSDLLIGRTGIDRGKLPSLLPSTEILGTLCPEAASELGLNRNVRVVMGSPDHQCACIGSGAVRDFEGHLYIGTSSWIEAIVPFKKTDPFHSIASLPSAIPGKYQCINEQDIAGGCLDFLLKNILFRSGPSGEGAPVEEPYRRLDAIASRVPPGSNGLIFTPWLNGERTPVDDHTLRAGIYNMSMRTTSDDVVRAFFEGVALNTRWSLKYVEGFMGRKMDPINMIGGGAKSETWCRIFADVMGRTIRKVRDPIQANARGAAFIASVGLGHIAFDDIPDLVEYDGSFDPEPDTRAIYDELFSEFVTIYRKNRAMYRRLNLPGR